MNSRLFTTILAIVTVAALAAAVWFYQDGQALRSAMEGERTGAAEQLATINAELEAERAASGSLEEINAEIAQAQQGLAALEAETGAVEGRLEAATTALAMAEAAVGEQETERASVEARLTEAEMLPEGQSLYDPESTTIVHHVNNALRAHKLFQKDQHYIVRNN
ncbi:MAG: hypothetical protein AAGF45_03955, partial [Pseudomonadota bacterium]